MSSIDPSVFSHEMLSLKTLKDWSLFTILKKVQEAGYTGPPSEPIAAYRRALLSTMSHNQPNENERIGDVYLKAEKAYISLDVCIPPTPITSTSNSRINLERVDDSRP